MIKKLLCICLLGAAPFIGKAQELNARITINSDKVQSTNKQVFKTLQDALNDFVNNKKWTDATFAMNERIDCSMTLIINEMVSDNSFKGEIQVQARRPVYNSSYTTTLLNYRDTELSFDYTEFEPLEYTENTLNSNLIATWLFLYLYDPRTGFRQFFSERWHCFPRTGHADCEPGTGATYMDRVESF